MCCWFSFWLIFSSHSDTCIEQCSCGSLFLTFGHCVDALLQYTTQLCKILNNKITHLKLVAPLASTFVLNFEGCVSYLKYIGIVQAATCHGFPIVCTLNTKASYFVVLVFLFLPSLLVDGVIMSKEAVSFSEMTLDMSNYCVLHFSLMKAQTALFFFCI